MDYQVWIKDEFGETYTKVDCGDLNAVKREIDNAVRKGGEPILTVAVPYTLDIKVSEVGTEPPKPLQRKKEPENKSKEAAANEADKGKPEPGQDTGAES